MLVVFRKCSDSHSSGHYTCVTLTADNGFCLFDDNNVTPQDNVGPHADDAPIFEGTLKDITIISLSLGGSRRFSIHRSHREEIAGITLHAGDLIAMELMGPEKI